MRPGRGLVVLALVGCLLACSKRERAAAGDEGVTMDRAGFWKTIADARAGANDEAFLGQLEARLRALPPEKIAAFQRHFEELHAASYEWDLWGAAYLIHGGCSDDGFEYFRAWLIAQGEQVYTRAVADPDSLAAIADPEGELEELMYVAREAYRARTGAEMPDAFDQGVERPSLGEGWDFDDPTEMATRYPKLAARYAP